MFINKTVANIFEKEIKIKLQFIYIHDNYSPSSCITTFDMDLTQITFDSENILGTRAAVEAMRTKTILHYGVTNDIIDYPRIALQLNKYLKRGFNLLTPHMFSLSQFFNCPLHIGNTQRQNISYSLYNTSEYCYTYNNIADNAIIFISRRNYDMFHFQNEFNLHVLMMN